MLKTEMVKVIEELTAEKVKLLKEIEETKAGRVATAADSLISIFQKDHPEEDFSACVNVKPKGDFTWRIEWGKPSNKQKDSVFCNFCFMLYAGGDLVAQFRANKIQTGKKKNGEEWAGVFPAAASVDKNGKKDYLSFVSFTPNFGKQLVKWAFLAEKQGKIAEKYSANIPNQPIFA